jgi:Cu2+-exporting ATPase
MNEVNSTQDENNIMKHDGHMDHTANRDPEPTNAQMGHDDHAAHIEHGMQQDHDEHSAHTASGSHGAQMNHEEHRMEESEHGEHKAHTASTAHGEHNGHSASGAQDDHAGHVDHTGHEEMFRKRFWVSLVLSIPVLLYSPMVHLQYGCSVLTNASFILLGAGYADRHNALGTLA